ncbi:hypothetical protein FQN54_008469 [Arachnomyces sp. PD_36]|nr:hypothetical protein FQN54_008469 [Arachnomyces sp. PD_36]
MPYNTRRKSLSLPSLGIHLPSSSRSHRSPSTTTTTSTMATPTTTTTTTDFLHPSKKVKRAHDPPSSLSHPPSGQGKSRGDVSRRAIAPTPPPSPPATTIAETKIDTEGINDDIVVAVIEQLEKTGNRPHLIKELAAIMSTTNDTVANSANPAALLSSRLSLYLKRSWTALAPCPLAKELIPVHPRRVFFYLTTSPHQPLPENSDDIISPISQITPSVSNVSDHDDDEEEDLRERAQLSPSPEVDLSTEFDEDQAQIDDDLNGRNASVRPPTPNGSFSARSSLGPHDHSHNHGPYSLSHNHRAISPPLEGDEKEFTQTASSVRERTSSTEDLRHKADDGLDTSDDSNGAGSFASSMDADNQMQDDADPSADNPYHEDYISSDIMQHYQNRGLETTTTSALFPARPPSPVSDSSTPLTAPTSVAEPDSDDAVASKAVDVHKVSDILKQTQTPTPLSIDTAMTAATSLLASVVGSKRSIDMVDTESTTSSESSDSVDNDVETPIPMPMPMGLSMSFDTVGSCGSMMGNAIVDVDKTVVIRSDSHMDFGTESWSDLRSPETVEVGELDEIFADI